VDFADSAVDEEPMKDLIADHFQSLVRRHGVVAVLVVGRLWTDGATSEVRSLRHNETLDNRDTE